MYDYENVKSLPVGYVIKYHGKILYLGPVSQSLRNVKIFPSCFDESRVVMEIFYFKGTWT